MRDRQAASACRRLRSVSPRLRHRARLPIGKRAELDRITDVAVRRRLQQLSAVDRQHRSSSGCRSRTTRCRIGASVRVSLARRRRIIERIHEFEAAGVDLLLLQCSPQYEEMERLRER